MTYTKPCTRPGCDGICTSHRPSQHARRQYCSGRCAAIERIKAGIRPPRMPKAHYQAIGSKGGKRAGISRRKVATLSAAKHLGGFIPDELADRLGSEGSRRVLALLARALRLGRTLEASRLRMARRDARERRKARANAA